MALVAATRTGIELVGETVTTARAGIDVRCLAAGGGRIFAGTQGDGVLRSDDGGHDWQGAGLAGHIVKALAVSADTVWAGTKPPRLFKSDDAGTTWRELPAFAQMRRPWWFQPAERPFTSYVSTLACSGKAVVGPRTPIAALICGSGKTFGPALTSRCSAS